MGDEATGARAVWSGQAYSIKRHGTSITTCDSEPVQTPGCIQSHGVLLVLRSADLTIVQASENCARWLGDEPEKLLGRPVASAIGERAAGQLRSFLEARHEERNPLFACTVDGCDGTRLDAVVHLTDGVVIMELEEGRDEDARSERDDYALIKRSVARLQSTTRLNDFWQTVSDEVRALTGLERVMIYRFHEDGHGEVCAESKQDDLPSFLGLHYPAEDIPQPAREVFRQIWIRPVPDIDVELAEMVPLTNPDTGKPLPMTHCALRGPSVMYTEYLRNMGVKASLTMSIRHGGTGLWGLIACHQYSGTAHLSHRIRTICELLAQVVSLQREAAQDREDLVYRLHLERVQQQLVANAARDDELTAVATQQPSLLDALDATGAALYHQDRWWRLGSTPSLADLTTLGDWLFARPELKRSTRPYYATDSLSRDFPPAAAFADVASGLLALPLSRTQRRIMVWFRAETLQTVHWGGDPNDKPMVTGPHGPRLTPRRSFELFVESVRLRSRPWLSVEIEAACRLRLLLLELIVNRADRLAALHAELVRSNEELDAFAYVASHDLKEPLRGIHRYAHQMLDEAAAVGDEQRAKVESLMRLTLRMDSLLDSLLYFSRVGRTQLLFEPVNLDEVLGEAIEMVDVRRDERPTELVIPRPLPVALCDRVRVREVLVNLLSNAMKYNDKPVRRIEVGYIEPEASSNLSNEAPCHTVYYVRDNGIGIAAADFEAVFRIFKRLHGRDAYGGGSGAGLTIVKKLVERHGGKVWLESVPGDGATFFFVLPCDESVAHV